ncbi:gp53-like domain-containing protein [Achromobacter sp. AGC78]
MNSSTTATFPFALPNACLKAIASESNSSAWFTNDLTVYGVFNLTRTSVGVTAYRWNGSGFVTYTGALANVIAIGY